VSGERAWREGQTLNRARKAGGVGQWDEKGQPRAARAKGRGGKAERGMSDSGFGIIGAAENWQGRGQMLKS